MSKKPVKKAAVAKKAVPAKKSVAAAKKVVVKAMKAAAPKKAVKPAKKAAAPVKKVAAKKPVVKVVTSKETSKNKKTLKTKWVRQGPKKLAPVKVAVKKPTAKATKKPMIKSIAKPEALSAVIMDLTKTQPSSITVETPVLKAKPAQPIVSKYRIPIAPEEDDPMKREPIVQHSPIPGFQLPTLKAAPVKTSGWHIVTPAN